MKDLLHYGTFTSFFYYVCLNLIQFYCERRLIKTMTINNNSVKQLNVRWNFKCRYLCFYLSTISLHFIREISKSSFGNPAFGGSERVAAFMFARISNVYWVGWKLCADDTTNRKFSISHHRDRCSSQNRNDLY
jgi:hypothetical protein